MRVSFLVPAGFLGGAGLCAWMLKYAPPAVAVDRAQPLVVVTYWQQFGARMWLALAIAIAISSAGYVGVLWQLRRRRVESGHRNVGTIVVVSALACGAALLFPVMFSSDVYAYAGYGDMTLRGISPYAHARIAARDPLLDAMVWQWGNPPPMCVYGPVFVWIAQGIVAILLPVGAAAPLWALRVLACLALVSCAPLAYAAFSRFPRSTRLAAAAGVALNPVAIWSAAEGHNDAIALAVVLGGFVLAARRRTFAGALVIALSILVKAPGAAAAIALAVASWPNKSRFLRAACGAALGIGIAIALALPLEYGVRTQLAPAGRYFPQFSPQYASVALTAVLAGALVFASFFQRSFARAMPLLVFAAWVAIPNPYPWYAVWLLPVAFLVWRSGAAWGLIAASLLIVLRYYGDATTDLSRSLTLAIVAVEFGLPLIFISAHMAIARRGRREIRTPVPGFATPRSP